MRDLGQLSEDELLYEFNLCKEILLGAEGLRERAKREEYSSHDDFMYAIEVWEQRLARAESEVMSRYLLG